MAASHRFVHWPLRVAFGCVFMLLLAPNADGGNPPFQTETVVSSAPGRMGRGLSLASGSAFTAFASYYDDVGRSLNVAFFDGWRWTAETVDSGLSNSEHTSIAVDWLDRPYVSYLDYGTQELKLAKRVGSNWYTETVATSVSGFAPTDIAVDSNSYPHIIYSRTTPDAVRYAYEDASGWHFEIIDGTGSASDVSIVVTSSDVPHVSYRLFGGTLKYAERTGGSWTVSPVSGNAGSNSLAFGTNGEPRIAFSYSPTNELRYAIRNFGVWSTGNVIDNTETSYSSITLTIDGTNYAYVSYNGSSDVKWAASSNGTAWGVSTIETAGSIMPVAHAVWGVIPHLVFRDESLEAVRHLKYWHGKWEHRWVDGQGPAGLNPAIAQDSDGFSHILHQSGADGHLQMTRMTPGGWDTTYISSGSNTVQAWPSMATDGGGNLTVAFSRDRPGQDAVEFGRFIDPDWQFETVVSGSINPSHTSLAYAPDGSAHIAYRSGDSSDGDAMYATNSSGLWVVEPIATSGDVGLWVRIAVDSGGIPHVVYLDETNDQLMYAMRSGGSWAPEVVTSLISVDFLQLGLDASDVPRIGIGGGSPSIADRSGGVWTVTGMNNLSRFAGAGVFDANDNLLLVRQANDDDVELVVYGQGFWVVDQVAPASWIDQGDMAITTNATLRPYFCYYDPTTEELIYGTRQNGIDLRPVGGPLTTSWEDHIFGETMNVNPWAVRNQGGKISGNYQARAYLSADGILDGTDQLLWTTPLSPLAGYAEETVPLALQPVPNVPDGNYYLGVLVDDPDLNAEFEEANNGSARPTRVFQPIWTDASAPPFSTAGFTIGVALGDFDGDGDDDVYRGESDRPNFLLRNEGAGAFFNATSAPLDDSGRATFTAWADIDNDGDLDLFLANYVIGTNKLFRNDGGGAFTDITESALGTFGNTRGAAWADYDLDGLVDLYVIRGGGVRNQLFRNQGGGSFVDVTTAPLDDSAGQGAAWGDVDGDGDPDLYLVKYDNNRLYRNDGGGNFVDIATSPANDGRPSVSAAWGDADNDGDLDLYIVNLNATNSLILNDGSGTFTSAGSLLVIGELGDSSGAAWGDYDNDGDLDLYVANDIDASRLFKNEGGAAFSEVAARAFNTRKGTNDAAWGDMDGDGRLDLVLSNNSGAQLLLNADPNTNHWIQLRLHGVVSNGAAIGARVKVVHDGVEQVREISGGGAGASQSSLVASFGLGGSVAVDYVEISWPSRIVQTIYAPAIDQLYEITEVVPDWVDVAFGSMGGGANHNGAAWDDYDDNGVPDAYVTLKSPYQNMLLRSIGNDQYIDQVSGVLASTAESGGAIAVDFDNDGASDLFVCNAWAPNILAMGDGVGGFTDASVAPLNDAGPTVAAAAGDYDHDGNLDLYIVNDGTANRLVRNNGDGTWVEVTTGTLGDSGNGECAIWGDYDNDGLIDLYLVNLGTANRLWHNDGGGVLTEVTGSVVNNVGNGIAAAWGDYDGDGDLDLYLANQNSANSLFRNNGDGSFSDVTTPVLLGSGASRGIAWGDYDNDTDLDLYLAHDGPGNQLLRNDGGGVFADVSASPVNDAGGHQAVVWVDIDQDGDLDLHVTRDDGPNSLYRNMVPGTGHWLHVDLEGTASNRAAIGARVRIVAGGNAQIREVTAGTGYRSHETARVEFGLGAETIVDSLIVRWPSGIEQIRVGLVADQFTYLREAPWSDATDPVLAGLATTKGISWADLDGDDRPDLFLANQGPRNVLLQNTAGGFVDPVPAFLPANDQSYGVACADYDNDGDIDIFVSNQEMTLPVNNLLFRNDGGLVFTDVTTSALEWGLGPAPSDPSWIDFNGDGLLDLYMPHQIQFNRLMENLGSDTFVNVAAPPLSVERMSDDAAWGDYDDDGDLDVYVCQSLNTPNALLRNDGSGVFVDVTPGPLADTDDTQSAAWGDYDGDGDLDLYLTKFNKANRLLRNDGATTFVDVTSGSLGDAGYSYGSAWADYDNDGDLDLYVTNHLTPDLLLNNVGGGSFVDAADGPMGAHHTSYVCAWADYDGDGDLDLYVAGVGANQLLRNELVSDNHWLHADLVGTISNRSAIGARVWLYPRGGAPIMREISDDAGGFSQNSLTVEFGTGPFSFADSIVVRWPSGLRQVGKGVVMDQKITITEGGIVTGTPETVVRRSVLHQAVPNPFNAHTTIRYELREAARVHLVVVDMAGRRVKTLEGGRLRGAGPHEVHWNGTDHAGHAVASGVYFYRIEAGNLKAAKRMVLVK